MKHEHREKGVSLTQKNIIWLAIFLGVLIWSAINPKDYPTWWLEVAPALIALAVLAWTRKTFALTPMLYVLILIHSIILMIGGHYTYAEVPLFDWLKELFNLERNNYDKLGHLAQGFSRHCRTRNIAALPTPGAGKNAVFYSVLYCAGHEPPVRTHHSSVFVSFPDSASLFQTLFW